MIETTDFQEKEKAINSILSQDSNDLANHISNEENLEKEPEKEETAEMLSNNEAAEESSEKEFNMSKETLGETTNIEIEDANTTNCLALTIQKDHKLVAVKNVVIRSIRMTWKVVVSTVALTLLKLFS